MPKKKEVKLKCDQCGRINYRVHKSNTLATQGDKLELKKFCKWCRKHTVHKETK